MIDWDDLKKNTEQILSGVDRKTQAQLLQDLLNNLPIFERDVQRLQENLALAAPPIPPPAPTAADRASFSAWRSYQQRVFGLDIPEAELRQQHESTPDGHVGRSKSTNAQSTQVMAGEQKYTDIRVPVLAIFAVPHDLGPYGKNNPALAAYEARDTTIAEGLAKAFEAGVPSARLVRLPHANHYIFMSNEADVLREMRQFLAGLP